MLLYLTAQLPAKSPCSPELFFKRDWTTAEADRLSFAAPRPCQNVLEVCCYAREQDTVLVNFLSDTTDARI